MMDKNQQLILSDMIQKKEFHGIPLSEIDINFLDCLEEQDLKDLYIVMNMVQLEMIDDYVSKNSIWH